MSKEFVKAVLREEATRNMPTHPDLWPAIAKQIYRADQPSFQTQPVRTGLNPSSLLLGGATLALLLIALWFVSVLSQLAPVARTEGITAHHPPLHMPPPDFDLPNIRNSVDVRPTFRLLLALNPRLLLLGGGAIALLLIAVWFVFLLSHLAPSISAEEIEEIAKAWQGAARRARYRVFNLDDSPTGLKHGRPWYDERRKIISQQYQGKAFVKVLGVVDASGRFMPMRPVTGPLRREIAVAKLIITQGPPASIKADGMGEGVAVQVGRFMGRFYSQEGAHTLILDREGTRIKLYALRVAGAESTYTIEELVKIAETLQLVGKK